VRIQTFVRPDWVIVSRLFLLSFATTNSKAAVMLRRNDGSNVPSGTVSFALLASSRTSAYASFNP
jgi:hypothetical protein